MTDEELEEQLEKESKSFDEWIKKNADTLGKLWLNQILSEAYFAGYEAGLNALNKKDGKK